MIIYELKSNQWIVQKTIPCAQVQFLESKFRKWYQGIKILFTIFYYWPITSLNYFYLTTNVNVILPCSLKFIFVVYLSVYLSRVFQYFLHHCLEVPTFAERSCPRRQQRGFVVVLVKEFSLNKAHVDQTTWLTWLPKQICKGKDLLQFSTSRKESHVAFPKSEVWVNFLGSWNTVSILFSYNFSKL